MRRLLIFLILFVGVLFLAGCQPMAAPSVTAFCDRLHLGYMAGGIDQATCVAMLGGAPPPPPFPADICTNPRYYVWVLESATGAPAVAFDPATFPLSLPNVPAGPAGDHYEIDVPLVASYPVGTLFDVSIVYLDAAGAWQVVDYFDLACTNAPTPYVFEIAPNLLDGRINDNMDKDVAAPVAVYCDGGIINIYTLDEAGHGYLAIQAAPGQIADAGIPEGEAIVLAEHGDIRLYRLPGGGFQVNAGITDPINGYDPNAYTFTFSGCPEDANAGRSVGRVNAAADPAAIHCTNGDIEVYRLVDGNGVLALRVSASDIAAAGVAAEPLLLGQAGDIALYRLNTGAFQVNGPGDYAYTWAGCR